MRRREFLQWGLTNLLVAGANPQGIFRPSAPPDEIKISSEKENLLDIIFSKEFPFPYDENYFECAERICNICRIPGEPKWRAGLNLILKPGKTLDLKVILSDSLEGLAQSKKIIELSGVKDVIDLDLTGEEAKRAYYQVLYREGKENWKALSPKGFKLPFINLEKGETIKAIFIADDHNFDDAYPEIQGSLKEFILKADYMVSFLRELKKNINWRPAEPLNALKNSHYLALANLYILAKEDPDFILLMGDNTGLGAFHRWPCLGLPTINLKDSDYNWIARLFWLRMRKFYSALSPYVPIFIVLGNHDGEAQWQTTASWGTYWRNKLFALPRASHYPEGGHPEGKYYALSWGADKNNKGGVLFIILNTTAFSGPFFPTRLENWTLGQVQRQWLEKTLAQAEKDWIFLCAHHVLGGWPAGPEETRRDIVYGRGPLFTAEDYKEYGNPDKIEQVWITQKAMENGARAFLYGHDHIFYSKKIGHGLNNLELYGICCGTTKYIGEISWWAGPLWQKHYGSYSRIPPNFWGPSGITRATIAAKETKFDYVMTGWTVHSNLPTGLTQGYVLKSVLVSNPPAKLSYQPNYLSFHCVEDEANPEEKVLLVKNTGSGRLEFKLKTNSPWLKIYPQEEESWGREKEVKVSINTSVVEVGSYQGWIIIESPQCPNFYGQIKVDLKVDPPPLFPPLNLKGARRVLRKREGEEFVVVLSWQPNPLNRKIMGYRIYVEEHNRTWKYLDEVPSYKESYVLENISFKFPLKFGVCSFDRKNRESDKAIVILR